MVLKINDYVRFKYNDFPGDEEFEDIDIGQILQIIEGNQYLVQRFITDNVGKIYYPYEDNTYIFNEQELTILNDFKFL